METTYRSKISFGILIPLIILLFMVNIYMSDNGIWKALIKFGIVILFLAYLYFNTSYVFTTDNKLKIRCGIFVNKEIIINNINKIKRTRNPTASPSLSMDRLEISYNKKDIIIISPEKKETFLQQLKESNPTIIFEL